MFKKSAAPAAGGYSLSKSLRFRASASAYLSRSYAGGAGSTTTFTISFWVKRGQLNATNATQYLFSGGSGANTSIGYGLGTVLDTLSGNLRGTGGTNYFYETNAIFRDPSAWYHIVWAIDTTQATSSNRMLLYVNGVLQTLLVANYPPQNQVLLDTGTRYIASEVSRYYADGYMAEFNYIDGQQLTPSSFGSNSGTGGVWQPTKYTGAYGTNGFYLKFTDTTSTTTLCYDYSGNSNNWTPNNISLTAGTTYDSMTDVPTLTSATTANYCVLNPLDIGQTSALANGNLNFSSSSSANYSICRGTFGVSTGKWYWENTINSTSSGNGVGIATSQASLNNYLGADAYGYCYYQGASKYNNGSGSAYGASYTTGDVIGIALDLTAGTLTFYKNNTSQGTAFTSLSGTFFPSVTDGSSGAVSDITANFGQQPFAYTPPTGYVALNTYNLSTPTIAAGNQYMDATLYTGNGSSLSVTNSGSFKPNFVWLKARSQSYYHNLNDSVRGTNNRLFSNTTGAEDTTANCLTAFNSNGFTVGSNQGINENTTTYVGWQWQAGQGSTTVNTNGSITSNVSVSTTAGFSVVTYTGTGATGGTVGHGLGVAPSFIIVKNRPTAGYSWICYHSSLGINQYILLNLTGAAATLSNVWGSAVNSTTFGVFANSGSTNNTPGDSLVAYCWSEIAGFSAFGSYTGNGSADGPFIYTGFRPKFVIYKNSSATGSWAMLDTSRGPYNVVNPYLLAESSTSEDTSVSLIDILSNGFKLRNNYSSGNANGNNYIYAAFAENPFKYALAR